MKIYRGLLYVKHSRIGTRSEGPDCFLQTAEQEIPLQLNERHPWEPDYQLEFYGWRTVVVKGDWLEDGMLQVEEIHDTGEFCIVPPGEEQAI